MDEHTTNPPTGDEAPPQPPVPRTGDDGQPVYDQEFFLALARCGKDVWNKWRKKYPDIAVTFEGIDFTQQGNGINFSAFEFGDFANFCACNFGDGFALGFVGGAASFVGTRFGGADFSGTTFGDYSDFSHASFASGVDLVGATFGEFAIFSRATFGRDANLVGTAFGHGAVFNSVTFQRDANFKAHSIDLWKRVRGSRIDSSKTLRLWTQEQKDAFLVPPENRAKTHPGPEGFLRIAFSNVRFLGNTSFSGRKFRDRCDLTGARFSQPPSFDSCDGLDRIDLYGARIGFAGRTTVITQIIWRITHRLLRWSRTPGWTTDSEVGNQLRRLRRLAEMTKNHDLERDLYIEERKAERGILLAHYWRGGRRSLLSPRFYGHCVWIVVMAIFWLFADYGRGFLRPLLALALSVPLFWCAYSAVLIPPSQGNTIEAIQRMDVFTHATWAFAISNAVPFVGALTLERDVKLTLLCGDRPIDAQHAQGSGQPGCVPIPGRRFQLLALGQSIFSALCIFFAGLALRNYFKLR